VRDDASPSGDAQAQRDQPLDSALTHTAQVTAFPEYPSIDQPALATLEMYMPHGMESSALLVGRRRSGTSPNVSRSATHQ